MNKGFPAACCLAATAFLVCCSTAHRAPAGQVITYPALPPEVLSQDYEISVDGKPVDVCRARVQDPPFSKSDSQYPGYDFGGPYSFANFDMSGRVTARIVAKRSLADTVIRPQTSKVRLAHLADNVIAVTLDGPQKISIEPDGKKGPLFLFANPLETNRPAPDAPGVIYFGAGLHNAGAIRLTNDQTLYLAGGAVIKGSVAVRGSNVCIRGRGIFKNIQVAGAPGAYRIELQGADPQHDVRGVTFQDVSVLGEKLTRQKVKIGNHVANVTFLP